MFPPVERECFGDKGQYLPVLSLPTLGFEKEILYTIIGTVSSFLLSRKTWKLSMPVVSSLLRFLANPLFYTKLGMVSFLEDATTRILLVRMGGGYSFVHRLLL